VLVGSPLFRAQAALSKMSQQWSPAEAVLSPGHTGKGRGHFLHNRDMLLESVGGGQRGPHTAL